MTKESLTSRYFEWLYNLVNGDNYSNNSYIAMFSFLHNTDFYVLIAMDENRACDGIDLRYRFGEEFGCEQSAIATILDIHPCSVLEMLVALALRCEENIMDDPSEGNRVSKWFWIMLKNLGLGFMDDKRYDERYCASVIHKFLNREYSRDGKGGLFVIENCRYDLRRVEIWYQMCWYLDSILNI